MSESVVANLMPLLHHPPYEARILFDLLANDEECRLYLFFSEQIENGTNILWPRSVVEGESDLLKVYVAVDENIVAKLIGLRIDARGDLSIKPCTAGKSENPEYCACGKDKGFAHSPILGYLPFFLPSSDICWP